MFGRKGVTLAMQMKIVGSNQSWFWSLVVHVCGCLTAFSFLTRVRVCVYVFVFLHVL